MTIVTPGRPEDRWRAILPLGVLPDDGTTIGARSLCDLMDKLDVLYLYGGYVSLPATLPLDGAQSDGRPRRTRRGQRAGPLDYPARKAPGCLGAVKGGPCRGRLRGPGSGPRPQRALPWHGRAGQGGIGQACHNRADRVAMATRQFPTGEAARRLKVTPHTIRRWLASGRLTGQRVGWILVVDEAAITEI
jgi:excisionase family DNA binding protein